MPGPKPRTDEQLVAALRSNCRLLGPTGCLEWTRSKNDRGYGKIRARGRLMYAHRLSYELAIGPVPTELMVLHRCDNRCCINPDHLFLGTHQENMDDRDAKARQCRGEAHGRHKITEADAIEIIGADSRAEAVSVARRIGISPSHARDIFNGEKWKHLQGQS